METPLKGWRPDCPGLPFLYIREIWRHDAQTLKINPFLIDNFLGVDTCFSRVADTSRTHILRRGIGFNFFYFFKKVSKKFCTQNAQYPKQNVPQCQ